MKNKRFNRDKMISYKMKWVLQLVFIIAILSVNAQNNERITNPNTNKCVPSISPSNPKICPGQSVTLKPSVTLSNTSAVVTGTWSPSGGIPGDKDSYTVSPAVTTTYSFKVSTPACAANVIVKVTVVVLPVPVMTNNNVFIVYSGYQFTCNLTSDIPASYTWQAIDNPNVIGETTTLKVGNLINEPLGNTSSVDQTVLYTVTPITADNCQALPYTIQVIVKPCIPPEFDFTADNICSSSNPGAKGRVAFNILRSLPVSPTSVYTWEFENSLFEEQSATSNYAEHMYNEGFYTVKLTYSNKLNACPTQVISRNVQVVKMVAAHSLTASKTSITLDEVSDLTFSASMGSDAPVATKLYINGNLISNAVSPYTFQPTNPGLHVITVEYDFADENGSVSEACRYTDEIIIEVNGRCTDCYEVKCRDCISPFGLIPGETYVLSAWVQQSGSETATQYEAPTITIDFVGGNISFAPFSASGPIIDGWQRIDREFTVPQKVNTITLQLNNTSPNLNVYFDDIRIHPKKASLKSFVYDPVSMRLMAELDENNYATFYEYDEEGALIRVKKETERGIKTIKESGNNTHKIQ